MQAGQASRTAEYMAMFRALEGSLPASRRLFEDPFARRFLSGGLALAAGLARIPGGAALECRIIDRRWPGVRTSAVARTRFIDDGVVAAVAGGARQIVILGAGFDARAFRLAPLRACVVFEVDHPDTQERKRRLLGPHPAGDVRFVAVDFASDKLDAALAAQGFRSHDRCFAVWEGVTNYLPAHAVDQTLRWFATTARGSEILFTYIHDRVLRCPEDFFGTGPLLETLKAAGEVWKFGIDPPALPAYLRERGLELLEDVGASDYRALYWGPAASRMRGYEFYRIARARVP
jgi:methyltransferase (TIGR00027 family)